MCKAIGRIGTALILVVGCLGCGEATPPGGNASGNMNSNTPAGYQPAPSPSNPTLDYWQGLNGLSGTLGPELQSQQPDQVVRALRYFAARIQDAPTLGVDPAVAGWGLRVATLCEQKVNFIENSNDPAFLVEAFLRGADGDPFGPAVEQARSVRQWQASYGSVRQEGFRLRAALTAHYGIEFPPCLI